MSAVHGPRAGGRAHRPVAGLAPPAPRPVRGAEEGIGEAMASKVRNALSFYEPLRGIDSVGAKFHGTTLYNSIYRADDLTLFEGMREAARMWLPVAVHAESQELTSWGQAFRPAAALPGGAARDFLNSRPVIAEVEAIQRASLFAAETCAKLHIVHVSSGRGVIAAAEARARGADVRRNARMTANPKPSAKAPKERRSVSHAPRSNSGRWSHTMPN